MKSLRSPPRLKWLGLMMKQKIQLSGMAVKLSQESLSRRILMTRPQNRLRQKNQVIRPRLLLTTLRLQPPRTRKRLSNRAGQENVQRYRAGTKSFLGPAKTTKFPSKQAHGV